MSCNCDICNGRDYDVSDEGRAVFICDICKESILEQQEYLKDLNGWLYCEECIKDMTHYAYKD